MRLPALPDAPYRTIFIEFLLVGMCCIRFDSVIKPSVTKKVTILAQRSQAAVTLEYELPLFDGCAHPHFACVHARRAAYIGVDCSQCRDQSGGDSAAACIAARGGTGRIEGGARRGMGAWPRSGKDHP